MGLFDVSAVGGPITGKHSFFGRDMNPMFQKIQDASLNKLNTKADAQYNPIASALNAQYDAQIDPLRKNTYAGWAERGWGQSGGAGNAITTALAGLEGNRQGALNQAKDTVTSNIQGQIDKQNQMSFQKEQLKLQKDANRPTFFGIPL